MRRRLTSSTAPPPRSSAENAGAASRRPDRLADDAARGPSAPAQDQWPPEQIRSASGASRILGALFLGETLQAARWRKPGHARVAHRSRPKPHRLALSCDRAAGRRRRFVLAGAQPETRAQDESQLPGAGAGLGGGVAGSARAGGPASPQAGGAATGGARPPSPLAARPPH